MRCLVTGAGGFVGGHLCEFLQSQGDTVLGTVRTVPSRAPLFETTSLDVTDAAEVARIVQQFLPEVVFILAGMAFVPDAESDFNQALLANVGSVHHTLRACHILQRKIKVVVVSSAEIYGRVTPPMLPLKEEQPSNPANNYSLSKCMAEATAVRYGQYGQVLPIIVRPFNHLGAGQSDKFVASSFAHQLVKINKGLLPPVLKVGNLDAKRDFSDVRDIVRGYRLAAERGAGTYNLCSGTATSIREILDTLIEISGLTVSVELDPMRLRAAEIPVLVGSSEKAAKELGWHPKYTLRETLSEVYGWWLKQYL